MSGGAIAVVRRHPLVATFLTCVLLGPPVGALVIASSVIDELGITTAIFSLLLLVPFSYVSGGLSALASGIAMVAYGWLKGQPPLWFALACALVTFAVLQWVQTDQAVKSALALLLAHVVSALMCWMVFRRFWLKQA
jgi:hypothetical protein